MIFYFVILPHRIQTSFPVSLLSFEIYAVGSISVSHGRVGLQVNSLTNTYVECGEVQVLDLVSSHLINLFCLISDDVISIKQTPF